MNDPTTFLDWWHSLAHFVNVLIIMANYEILCYFVSFRLLVNVCLVSCKKAYNYDPSNAIWHEAKIRGECSSGFNWIYYYDNSLKIFRNHCYMSTLAKAFPRLEMDPMWVKDPEITSLFVSQNFYLWVRFLRTLNASMKANPR